MAIQPLSLPSAAGIEYGHGDVRHFSEGDDQSVVGLSNPTRQLAQRDNLIQEKLNEVVATVNNQEQFVPLPVSRTTLPPSEEVVVLNYRIPAGFESRVLNASVASTPASTDIELIVYYNAGYGGSAGTNVVTTSSEFTGGVQFYQEGEFIIAIKNKGAVTLDMAASVLLTVRPLGAQGTLLVGSTIKGDKGDPGPTGPRGVPGPPGTGGAGSPGMNFTGPWASGITYTANDVATFTTFGTVISSYIVRVGHVSNGGNAPNVDPVTWNPVATGGGAGPPGPAGSPGVAGNAPIITTTLLSGTFITGADFVAGSTNGDYLGGGLPSTSYAAPMYEVSIDGSNGKVGYLFTSSRQYFKGHGTIRLPQQAVSLGGAATDYTNQFIQCNIVDNGTNLDVSGTHSVEVDQLVAPLTDFVVRVFDQYPVKVAINLFGAQSY